MSSSAGDLAEELRELLVRAREQGALEALQGVFRTFVEGHATPAPQAGDVPGRFGLVGDSKAMHVVFDLIERVAKSSVPVLIQGATGTGKELVARALHDHSPRAKYAFVAENCAAVPANLLESELFGHKKGSFTGAIADRDGHFVVADKGSIFLDEIGDMPLAMQSKLLRVLEENEVRPVGSNKVRKVDARVIAATHRDLAQMVEDRSFREDLYYRLNVIRIPLPPLSEREGDVAILTDFFLRKLAGEMGREVPEVTPEAQALLEGAPWPGNVRQLENEIRRSLALSRGIIDIVDLSPSLAG